MIYTFGSCRLNTPINYCDENLKIHKTITTNTSQIVTLIKYKLNKLSINEYREYNNIMPIEVFLRNIKNVKNEYFFNPNNTIFIEISTQKKKIYRDLVILPHDYDRKEIDVNNIINDKDVSITYETKQEIIDNLLYIKSFFRKIVVVTHIKNYCNNKTRDDFVDMIKELCNEIDINCISPCDYIDVNRRLYLEDNEHYSQKGYNLMYEILKQQYIKVNNPKNNKLFVAVALNYYKYFSLYQIYTLLKHNTCDILLIIDNYVEDEETESYFIHKMYNLCNEFGVNLTVIYMPNKYDYSTRILFEKIDNERIINDCKKIATPCKIAHFVRFIIPFKYYNNYKYVYIGDIDILLTGTFFENKTSSYKKNDLFKTHIEHCSNLKINFSNGYRKNLYRLTGLHFFINDKYKESLKHTFETFEEGIEFLFSDKYKELFYENYNNKKINLYNDETFLYYNQNEKDIKTLISNINYRPLHGFHIGGTVRSGGIYKYDNLTGITKKEYDLFYEEYIKDTTFNDIHKNLKKTRAGILVDKSINLKNM
jgi:hypothetical protein